MVRKPADELSGFILLRSGPEVCSKQGFQFVHEFRRSTSSHEVQQWVVRQKPCLLLLSLSRGASRFDANSLSLASKYGSSTIKNFCSLT